MIERNDDPLPSAANPAGTADANPWHDLAERARRELESWARSRPPERHRAERRSMTPPAPAD